MRWTWSRSQQPPSGNRARERRDAAFADRALRTGGRVLPDFGESARERAERLRQPVVPVQIGETWNGSQPVYGSASW